MSNCTKYTKYTTLTLHQSQTMVMTTKYIKFDKPKNNYCILSNCDHKYTG